VRAARARTGLGAALLSCGLAGCGVQVPALPAATGETSELVVARGTLEESLVLTGELDAEESIELPVPRTDDWESSIRWLAEDGAPVKAGAKVVEFDTVALLGRISERELAAIEASIALGEQDAKVAVEAEDKRWSVETQRIAVEKAELDVGVPEELVSRREARDFTLALTKAKAALVTAEGELKTVGKGGAIEREIKRIAYEKALRSLESATEQLDALVLTAPKDGIFLIGRHPWEDRKLQVGDTVWPGMGVARIPDLSKMVVQARLSDVDEGRVQPGMAVTCTVDAHPDRPVPGSVRAVSPVAHEAGRQSPRRFFEVVVDLEGADPEILRPGLSVRIEVHTRALEDVIVAPRAGLDLSSEPMVARLADGTTAAIEVQACTPQACAITAGLSEGDRLRAAEVVR
jgi:HlyD family secretion protein